ncbi:MAG: FAD-dependent oxidoreductase [Chloroflexota bacterium]|jgi:NADH-quinone oxidoreductase subunit F
MTQPLYRAHVLTCAGSGCTASGSVPVMTVLDAEVRKRGLQDEVRLVQTGCRGFCSMGPVMMVYPEGIFYCQVQPEDISQIVEETLIKGRPVQRLLYREPESARALPFYKDIPFYGRQMRIALRNCGFINPEKIDEYIARGGYEALGKAITEMTSEQIIDTLKRSGLRGRGGAGFLTGLKWELCKKAPGDIKYITCNADEGDPGAFMDRSILEGDPHTVLEGMAIAARAIGAQEGYVYCRAEYPLAIQRLRIAIEQANEYGLLGDNILGSDFSFNIEIKEGAGAFVCGEETALIASIEGRRGEPRPRPPFPTTAGLWGKPTNINNVETWANVPPIILHGAEWFASIGTEKSKGTKVFALTGKVNNTGLVEVPMGITLGDIIFDIGGGIPEGKKFKAVQTGGPLGGCLPTEQLNTPVDYDSLTEAGATMGSGGMIVVDEDTCMVEFAKFFLTFAHAESCGQCTPCRIGGKRMLEILNRITEGKGTLEDLEQINILARAMADSSLCALGQLTPSPTMSSLRYFKDEFIAHIEDKKCPAGVCKELVRSRCSNACPAGQDVPTYVGLIAEGRFEDAYEVITEVNPLPSVCGRVCDHLCERKCRRGQLDDPVAVRSLKRFVGDYMRGTKAQPPEVKLDKKVAIVGGGPAGLAAARGLAQKGYQVTIFEALPVLGGMLAVGIPQYRLPKAILQEEIENNILSLGVEVRTNAALGKDFTIEELKKKGFDAIFLALGAHKSSKLGIAGEDTGRVLDGVKFLRDANLGKSVDVSGKKIGIIGGGNVAMDAARIATRLGASEVHVIYRRTRDDMPADDEEIMDANEEGVKFHFLTAPKEILRTDGHAWGVRCTRMVLSEFDRSGRRRPVELKDSDFVIDVDMVIPAIGQATNLSGIDGLGLNVTREGFIQVDRHSMETNVPGIFAGGDVVTGPATVIEAIAAGNRAAKAIDRYLRGEEKLWEMPNGVAWERPSEPIKPPYEIIEEEGRRPGMPELSVRERRSNFMEVALGYTRDMAMLEARRCLRCDLEAK